jgi:hypothetical protein
MDAWVLTSNKKRQGMHNIQMHELLWLSITLNIFNSSIVSHCKSKSQRILHMLWHLNDIIDVNLWWLRELYVGYFITSNNCIICVCAGITKFSSNFDLLLWYSWCSLYKQWSWSFTHGWIAYNEMWWWNWYNSTSKKFTMVVCRPCPLF